MRSLADERCSLVAIVRRSLRTLLSAARQGCDHRSGGCGPGFSVRAVELVRAELLPHARIESGVELTRSAVRAASDVLRERVSRSQESGRPQRIARLESDGCEPVQALGQLPLETQALEPVERL